jgi:hypothetical protein
MPVVVVWSEPLTARLISHLKSTDVYLVEDPGVALLLEYSAVPG